MTKKIVIDPGHGGSDPGAVGKSKYGTFTEKNLTLQVAKMTQEHLIKNFEDVSVQLTRSGDSTLSLSQRTNFANNLKADFLMSIHFNASGSNASGYEDFIYSGTSDSSTTAKIRNAIHEEVKSRVITKYGIKNRGKKKANFHMVRESNMSAILVETLFVDGDQDQKIMKEKPQVLNDFGIAYAEGIAKALGLKRKSTPKPSTPSKPESGKLFRVQVGAFSKRSGAEELLKQLKAKGFTGFIKED